MTVSLPIKKKILLKKLVNQLLTIKYPKIRFVARVLGTVVAAFPGSKYGPLYYRHLDIDKTIALKTHSGNFDAHVELSKESLTELRWWKGNVDDMYNWISPPPIRHEMYCDASDTGWGVKFVRKSGVHGTKMNY